MVCVINLMGLSVCTQTKPWTNVDFQKYCHCKTKIAIEASPHPFKISRAIATMVDDGVLYRKLV